MAIDIILVKYQIKFRDNSLYFEINLRAVSLLNDANWKRVVKKGNDQTKSYLEELPLEEKFWLKNS